MKVRKARSRLQCLRSAKSQLFFHSLQQKRCSQGQPERAQTDRLFSWTESIALREPIPLAVYVDFVLGFDVLDILSIQPRRARIEVLTEALVRTAPSMGSAGSEMCFDWGLELI